MPYLNTYVASERRFGFCVSLIVLSTCSWIFVRFLNRGIMWKTWPWHFIISRLTYGNAAAHPSGEHYLGLWNHVCNFLSLFVSLHSVAARRWQPRVSISSGVGSAEEKTELATAPPSCRAAPPRRGHTSSPSSRALLLRPTESLAVTGWAERIGMIGHATWNIEHFYFMLRQSCIVYQIFQWNTSCSMVDLYSLFLILLEMLLKQKRNYIIALGPLVTIALKYWHITYL